ncbi:multidrug resistance protein [Escherichia coli]|uniref:Multidrug resistance protein n=1 Tax=Escherichia coli TaxID=562 RepID=A0A376TG85_ECOLX|nr:multidrug resistance protein [Escherichia coli]
MQKYISEARLLLALAIPVILAQIAQTAMGFVDTVMAGGYSATDMAAVAIVLLSGFRRSSLVTDCCWH